MDFSAGEQIKCNENQRLDGMLRSRKGNFTLIELLIVIAIIAILAAMLLPALNQAKQSAQNIQCVSNLKQVSLVSSMYLGDYKEFFPYVAGDVSPQVANNYIWACKFIPYINKNIKPLTTTENQQMYMNGAGQWHFPYAPVKTFSCPNFSASEPNGQLWRENGMHFGIHARFGGLKQEAGIRASQNGVRTWIFSELCSKASVNGGYHANDGGMCIHRHRNLNVNAACLDGRVLSMKVRYNPYFGGLNMALPKEYRYHGSTSNP